MAFSKDGTYAETGEKEQHILQDFSEAQVLDDENLDKKERERTKIISASTPSKRPVDVKAAIAAKRANIEIEKNNVVIKYAFDTWMTSFVDSRNATIVAANT